MKRTLFAILALLPAAAQAAADKTAYLHFVNGLVEERRGNYDLAMQEYRRTLLLDPEPVFVYKQALNLALHIGKLEDARNWADYVVKADSSTADNWVTYGNVRWAGGDMDGARAAYEKAAALDDQSYEALYQLASLWSGKDPKKAAGYLVNYLELRPDDAPEIYYQMAVLHNAAGDQAGARADLLKSKEADPAYPQPRYMLASLYEAKSDTAAALSEYLDLLRMEPKNLELVDHIGELYASPAVNDLASAESYFLRAQAIEKTDPTSCFWLSVISEQRRDFAAAAAYIERSAGLKDDAGLTLRLAYYYTQSGGYLKAIDMLEKSLKKWPDNAEIKYFLALGYDDTGKTSKARALLGELLKKNPDYAEARMQLAVISERVGDMPAVEENFRYLLAKNPGNANVLNYLGYALADRGQKLDEAEAMIEKAVALEPANGAYLDSLAWVKFRRGRMPEAMAAVKKAVAAVWDDPVVWGHAGDIYEAAGDDVSAWRSWKRAAMLEKAGKRGPAEARIKALQKKIPADKAAALTQAYLADFLPRGQEVSSFAKVEAKLRGKTVKFDALLHFSPPEDFSLTVMGPLMAPLWRANLTADGLEMDSMSIKEIDPEAFNYWASLIAVELRAWFSGAAFSAGSMADGWGSDCLTGAGREVCLGSDGLPERLRPDRERKLSFYPSYYFYKNMYLFPGKLNFSLPGVSVSVTLDAGQMNFKAENRLTEPGI